MYIIKADRFSIIRVLGIIRITLAVLDLLDRLEEDLNVRRGCSCVQVFAFRHAREQAFEVEQVFLLGIGLSAVDSLFKIDTTVETDDRSAPVGGKVTLSGGPSASVEILTLLAIRQPLN